ncbi:E3 ubiquitin/ISG15 ligase TRIM25-like [Anoplopoma fimbria]|uniref:E3 ubiquitin/ISG15 ligase TRIM25-like n=1 Tax=Anoplopoma fimbria TaxID=229290 RepID=UPI0023EE114B|nr:E3 ubiquitin/ISG15 ligase TRIM25-like [Anoplopoma fimbria]
MAEQQQPERGVDLDQDQFFCSVCLDLLKEPVSIPCGHSYCKGCIEDCWDQEEKKGRYSCPRCRETFSTRPALKRNTMLAEVVEKLKKSSTQQPSPSLAFAGPEDVACDFCSGTRRNKATMSCLTCLASYCPSHLEPHHSVPVLKKHQLVSATIPLQEKMCEKHNKLMEVYCRTDRKCICYLCVIDEHKEHDTVSSASERAEEQKQLIVSQKNVQQRSQEREEELNELLQALEDFKSSTQPAMKTCDEIFDEMICSIKQRCSLAKQLISSQEEAAVALAEELQLKLEEEISKMKRKDAELEKLSQKDDHIHFIQTFQSLSTSSESPDLPPVCVFYPQRSTFGPVTDCVSKLRDDIETLLVDTWPGISATVSTIDVVPPAPKTREEFLRYCCPLTLDESSISQYLSISQENRQLTSSYYVAVNIGGYNRGYNSSNPSKRIIMQALCSEGLSERCYWEVSWSGATWSVAVSYKDSSRTKDLQFGNDDKSWSLVCSEDGYSFRHNHVNKTVSGPRSSSVGVYLDYKLGTLSFYDISSAMTLLHKENIQFTQPVYPGLELDNNGSQSDLRGHFAELIKLW